MNDVSARMKVITPLGNEEFDMTLSGDVLTVNIFKGSADLSVEVDEENRLVASGFISIPFDCKLILEIESGHKTHGKVFIADPLLNEIFLEAKCEEL